MTNNYFKFGAVGQGLFYTGSLNDGACNFVYDCGTDSDMSYLHAAIDEFASRCNCPTPDSKPELEFVIISHLHSDHFNGLSYLKQKFNVHKVILPYMGYDKILVSTLLACAVCDDDNNVSSEWKKEILRILYYNYFENNRRTFEELVPNYEDNGYEYRLNYTHFADWEFLLFNRCVKKKTLAELAADVRVVLSDLIEIDYANGNNENIESIVTEYILNNPEQVAEVFKNRIYNLSNITSTVVLHYPLSEGFAITRSNYCCCRNKQCSLCLNCCIMRDEHYNTATLLTGDIEFDKAMINAIAPKIEEHKLIVAQIPHHGAFKNFKKSTWIDTKWAVISFGLGNKYHHPHSYVVKHWDSVSKVECVTQVNGFEYFIETV